MGSKSFWGSVALAAVVASCPAVAAPSGAVVEPAAERASPPVTSRLRKRVRTAGRPSVGVPEAAGELATADEEVAPAGRRVSRHVARTLPPPRPIDLEGAPSAEAAAAPGFDIRPSLTAAATPAAEPAAPVPPTNWFSSFFGLPAAQPRGTRLPALASRGEIDALITHHARLNGVPESLVHRIVVRESKYNPRAVGRGGAMGLMQIKTATARAVGYDGGPAGLLDAETNLTYGVKYLAGAYRTAAGNHDLSVSHYARGYYYAARRKGVVQTGSRRGRGGSQEADAAPEAAPATPSFFSFASRTASAADDRAAR